MFREVLEGGAESHKGGFNDLRVSGSTPLQDLGDLINKGGEEGEVFLLEVSSKNGREMHERFEGETGLCLGGHIPQEQRHNLFLVVEELREGHAEGSDAELCPEEVFGGVELAPFEEMLLEEGRGPLPGL